MNKTAIKNFAIDARKKLIEAITYKAGLIGVSADGIKKPLPQSTKDMQFFDIGFKEYATVEGKAIEQRNALVKAIEQKVETSDYTTAFTSIMEEIAYTWFNRLIAIRFMEVNDYLPGRVRMLSSELENKNEPDLVTNPFDSDLEFTDAEKEQIFQMKDQNKLEDLFRMLFIKQCNKLHDILPELFETTSDYTELLLNIAFADKDGVVYKLVHDIPEDDFNVEKEGQVEIIGWLYQYYNTVPKDETFALLKKNVKITKERIPAATQLFTPDWIVRYMVENSLGRLWLERNIANSKGSDDEVPGDLNEYFLSNWKYYLFEADQEPEVEAELKEIRKAYKNLSPEDIKVIDPCMGSGHILVYCFDVLMQIYEAQGYTQRDAAQAILANNLYGLDIDNRAAQLAYFAVMMKARQYDRRIFDRGIKPHVYAIQESNHVNRDHLSYLGAGLSPIEKNNAINEITGLLNTFVDAKEYGSILNVENYNWPLLRQFVAGIDQSQQMTLETIGIEITQAQLKVLVEIGETMARKYHVVVTNPPYMGSSGMGANLTKYVKDNYPDSKSDLFAVCIERGNQMTKKNGYNCMVTMQSWMFLSSFEKMRTNILKTKTITNLMHMENMVMGIAFGTAVTVFKNMIMSNYKGTYNHITLSDIENGQPKEFPVKANRFAQVSTSNFSKISGSPIAYWVSEELLSDFSKGKVLKTKGDTRQGMATSDNNRFLRLWYEVDDNKIGFKCKTALEAMSLKRKWYPYNKGGEFRKWYGNQDYLINYENDGFEVKEYAASLYKTPSRTIKSISEYFKPCLSWSKVSSGSIAFRYYPEGFIFDVAGCCIFYKELIEMLYDFGFINSKISKMILAVISPTLNYEAGHIASLPVIRDKNKISGVIELVKNNIDNSKSDWDSFETSWDFLAHPLVKNSLSLWDVTAIGATMYNYYGYHPEVSCPLELCYMLWQGECNQRFNQLKANEEELNRIFIDIYGLQDELTPEVEDKDVTVRKADLQRDIKSLLSYAVGCMFGRYSLDVDGLAYAGGEWDDSKYTTFIPDKDNCIPITDEEYFEDDIVGLFCAWLKKVYGKETLEENLDFIASALGNKGKTSREVIRNYFLNDFIKDHIKTYQKRPIYWLFDSGKQNGFKALVYMHRWNEDTVGNLRVEYLHRMQRVYDKEMERMQDIIDNSKNSKEVKDATNRKAKLQKQLKETRDYDEKIAHIALSRINIDLDDGVKVNYEKVQTGKDGKKVDVLAKI